MIFAEISSLHDAAERFDSPAARCKMQWGGQILLVHHVTSYRCKNGKIPGNISLPAA
jgi:hypothetical protein